MLAKPSVLEKNSLYPIFPKDGSLNMEYGHSINMSIETQAECSISDTIPMDLDRYIVQGTNQFFISAQFGHLIFQQFKIRDDFPFIYYNNYFLEQEQTFRFCSEEPHLCLQFELSNHIDMDMEGIGQWEIGQGTFNLLFAPSLEAKVTLRPGKLYRSLNIYLTHEDLAPLRKYNILLDTFLQKVAIGQASMLYSKNQPINPLMEEIIQGILISHLKGPMQHLFLEIKINELLLTCFDPNNEIKYNAGVDGQEVEVRRLCEAKKIWLENVKQPMSICMLARRTGMNENKLYVGFKRLFNLSPYGLILQARMEIAQQLLAETDLSVSEIADRIGYTGVQSFSKACKMFFKESPLQYRKKLQQH
jgi:AraC-like DNA-binding protein